MRSSQSISLFLLCICGLFMISVLFIQNINYILDLVVLKVYWYHVSILFLSLCCIVIYFVTRYSNKLFYFSFVDCLILLLSTIFVLTYKWNLNPEPERMLLLAQLLILWFLLRYVFIILPQLRLFFLVLLVASGLIEAICGILQLYGFMESNHPQFELTGDFYNPGPYSGYLALVLPICLWMIFRYSNSEKKRWKQINIFLYSLGWVSFLAIIIVLPAGMSRIAWISAIISCGWVYWIHRIGWDKTKKIINRYRIYFVVLSVMIIALVVAILFGFYVLKKDSADGRLFLWKVTTKSIVEQPLCGVGIGGFPAAYGRAQTEYFASGEASETEKFVAGCPIYGFNDFLQISLEQGLFGGLVFVILLGYSLFQGVRNKQIGATGGILSMILFGLASYPFQLPEFLISFVILMGIVHTPIGENKSLYFKIIELPNVVVMFFVALCSLFLFGKQNLYFEGYKKWDVSKTLYSNEAYNIAYTEYEKLLPLLSHKPQFLFEMSKCMTEINRFEHANRLLKRAMQLSAEPMIYCLAAKNEQSLGNYQEAEKLILYAIEILPERVYPYYLLTKLYSEPAFFNREGLINTANIVLLKEPKVKSSAIDEMRSEVIKILEDIP